MSLRLRLPVLPLAATTRSGMRAIDWLAMPSGKILPGGNSAAAASSSPFSMRAIRLLPQPLVTWVRRSG